MSMIVLGSDYAEGPVKTAGDNHGHGRHDGYAPPVSPDKLGGSYEFLDLKNRPVTASAFKGHWTLLFFGYARCRGSCPVATPKIVKAAQMLREKGIEARAVFVDIETPPLRGFVPGSRRPEDAAGGHNHGGMSHVAAMRALQSAWDGKLTVLTGTTLQLANAARAFMVTREHRPPREGETGHSINHSSRIYMIAPDTKVAGYGHHGSEPAELVKTVTKMSAHKRAAATGASSTHSAEMTPTSA